MRDNTCVAGISSVPLLRREACLKCNRERRLIRIYFAREIYFRLVRLAFLDIDIKRKTEDEKGRALISSVKRRKKSLRH